MVHRGATVPFSVGFTINALGCAMGIKFYDLPHRTQRDSVVKVGLQ
jgi:hypothetical protein